MADSNHTINAQSWIKMLALNVGIALCIYCAARLGVHFSMVEGSASLVWLGTGVAISAVLVFGNWTLPGIFMGAFLFSYLRGQPMPVGFLIATGNCIEAYCAVWLTHRFTRFGQAQEQARDLIKFAFVGAGVATLPSAVFGLVAMHVLGVTQSTSLNHILFPWWSGNAIGALLVTPAVIALVKPSQVIWDKKKHAEAGCITIAFAAVAYLFSLDAASYLHLLPFILFPILVWTAMHMGARGMAFGTLATGIYYIYLSAQGLGPFTLGVFPYNIYFLQLSMVFLSVTTYYLASAIEARALAEKNAEHFSERIRLQREKSPLAVIEWSPNFEVMNWNPAAERIFGWSEDEARGQHASFMVPDSIREEVDVVMEKLLETRGGFRSTNKNLCKSGTQILCDWYNVPLTNEQDDLLGIMSLVEDITEENRLKEERLKIEQKLQEGQKLESLGVMAGGIAHDFNNILTGIMGNASMLRSELGDGSISIEYVDAIEKSSARAAALCKEMLAYSGKSQLEVKPVNLNELIEGTLELIKHSTSKKAHIKLKLAEGIPTVDGDLSQLQQVLMNLIINASDALQGNTGSIVIRTARINVKREELDTMQCGLAAPEGDFVSLEVLDSGCGMPPAVRQRLFEPFYTTKFTGRGLGLAAALGIIRGHHGAVSVLSAPNKGTQFTVLIPVGTKISTHPKIKIRREEVLDGSPQTVLLIDDEEDIRNSVSKMLTRTGCTVYTASDGQEGLGLFLRSRHELDLIILDLIMPHLDGVEVYQKLLDYDNDVPVLIMSGYAEQDVTERFGNKSFNFIQKPFGLNALQEKIRAALLPSTGKDRSDPNQTQP